MHGLCLSPFLKWALLTTRLRELEGEGFPQGGALENPSPLPVARDHRARPPAHEKAADLDGGETEATAPGPVDRLVSLRTLNMVIKP